MRRWCRRGRPRPLYAVAGEVDEDYLAFDSTVGNAEVAVKTRVLVAVPEPDADAIAKLRRVLRRIAYRNTKHLQQPWSDAQLLLWISTLPRRKRERYEEAFYSLQERPFEPEDAKVKCFIKDEITKRKKGKFYKPRLIQYRSARYLVAVARYLKPIEEVVYDLRGLGRDKAPNVAKKHNLTSRARILRRKWETFRDPVALSMDGSAFDAHVNASLLKSEHEFYRALSSRWATADREVMMRLLKYQVKNKVSGLFPDGTISYLVHGNRMSGDLNTALGNVVLMVGMMVDFCERVGLPYSLYDDGDDIVVLVEREDASAFEREVVEAFLGYGMEMKVESTTSLFERVDFCQHRPVLVGDSWRMVRDPFKSMQTSRLGSRWHGTEENFRAYAYAVGIGDGHNTSGVPVLQEYYAWMRRCGRKPTDRHLAVIRDAIWRFRVVEDGPLEAEITSRTRASFERAWGVSPGRQVELEELWRVGPTIW